MVGKMKLWVIITSYPTNIVLWLKRGSPLVSSYFKVWIIGIVNGEYGKV